ncbi:PAS domain S-box protein [uncultured Rhodospira sp.]|uniref:PAS domain S-box protein n=1 Tax=uncultured Rhodospira sp. TaxID=1936189 RepID=UPI002620023A|nr:PAS domain S-box protein [uncultured Rhodospira sp.]
MTLYTLALDHLAEGVLLLESSGRIVYANHQAAMLFGHPADALAGTTFSAPIRTTGPVEITIPRTDRRPVIAEMQVVPLQAETDTLSLVSLRDMTGRYEAEAQLRESEATYRAVIATANDGFWLTDATGQLLEVNDAYLRMTGFSRSELLGCRPDFVDADEDADAVRARMAEVLESGGAMFETRHRTRDGRIIEVEVSVSFAPSIADGRLFVFIRDITPRKRAEASILAAKTAAEQANHAKSEFLAAMSHDLRTPLNAIIGFAEMIQMHMFGPLGDEHYEGYIADIHASGELLISLVDDLLDLSKVEAGKFEIQEQVVVVPTVMALARQQTATMAAEADQTIVIDHADDLPSLRGDQRALVQVFYNLLTNAIKFNRPNGPIRFTAALADDGSLEVRVADEGIGMSPDEVTKALKPFEQIDSAHARKHKGTGLGLYLCVQIMRLFGGKLTVDSTPNVGTTVMLWFPPTRVGAPAAVEAEAGDTA